MPTVKPVASNSLEILKSTNKNDTFLDAYGRPLTYSSRPGNDPVPLFQLLHAFDQPEIPGWPLLTPLKVQMHKCDKCSREFCSSINQRRHIRVQHRLRKLDRFSSVSANSDPKRERELLGEFWEKLSVDEAKEIVSLENVALDGIPGPSVFMALVGIMHKPAFPAVPPYYLRAGSALLEIIQGRSSRFPLSSSELFGILDDASEKTFLCGAAASLQKYVFNGDTGKMGLETRNLVACVSFLLEQKLVSAWLADKDVEAMKFQNLLVAEEEAAQRRQAEIIERKKQKKLRQKEQKLKDQRKENHEVMETPDGATEERHLDGASSPVSRPGSDTQKAEVVAFEDSPALHSIILDSIKIISNDEDMKCENVVDESEQRVGQRDEIVVQVEVHSKSQLLMTNGSERQNSFYPPHPSGIHGTGYSGEVKVLPSINTNDVEQTIRSLHESRPEDAVEASDQQDHRKNHQVFIGTIPVLLENCSLYGVNSEEECIDKHELLKEKVEDKFVISTASKRDTEKNLQERYPATEHGIQIPAVVETEKRKDEASALVRTEVKQTESQMAERNTPFVEDNVCSTGSKFNIQEARAFLAQRWKEALANEHWVLVPSGDIEPVSSAYQKLDSPGNFENQVLPKVVPEAVTNGVRKVKFRQKPETVARVTYIPKRSKAN